MLKRLKIENYKSFKSIEIRFKDINVIMGPNAAGKSNLLDAIYLISKIVTSRNINEAFKGHRGVPLESFYYGEEGFESLIKKDKISIGFEVDVELSPSTINEVNDIIQQKRKGLDSEEKGREYVTEKNLRYILTIEALPKTGVLRIVDEELFGICSNGRPKKSRNPFLGRDKDNSKLVLRMEKQAHPIYFDTGLDHSIVSTALYEPHYPHIVAFRRELEKWQTYYFEPRELMREEVPLADVNTIGSRGENISAFLNTLKEKYPKDFESLNLAIQQILPTKPKIDIELHKEGLLGLVLHESGLTFSARLISEGTLRIIGLISAIHPKNPSLLIGYEEPENGVHPVRLRHIATLFKNAVKMYGKQIIITTHSPLFAELFDNESLLVCEKKENYSIIKPFKEEFGSLYRRRQIECELTESILRGDLGG